MDNNFGVGLQAGIGVEYNLNDNIGFERNENPDSLEVIFVIIPCACYTVRPRRRRRGRVEEHVEEEEEEVYELCISSVMAGILILLSQAQ
ncbi:MAG: hypothetical protein ACFFDP_09675, partial [Promethearchaeota archaeon]